MKQYQIGMYEKAAPEEYPLFDILRLCKESGYDFLEISIDRTDKRISRLYDNGFKQDLFENIQEIGLPVGSMCLSALGTYTLGHPDPVIEKKAIDIFYHAILFAEEVGLRIVQIPACDVPKNDEHTVATDRRYIDNLKRLINFAAAHSVMIGLENMEDHYMDSVEKSLRMIQSINSPYFCLYSDSGNITSAAKLNGTDIKKDLLLGKNHYCAFHLKETKPNKYGGLFYGEGHVDFESVIKTAWNDLGIRRYVLEYWFTGNPKWKDDMIQARCLCDEWIKKAHRKGTDDETI